ncbi:MAG: alkaline phosphatase PhoX [Pyrinomonadaceae bacterium]
MDRRTFLRHSALSSAGIALASGSLANRASALEWTGNIERARSHGFGTLLPTPAKNTGETLLAMPQGFEYNVISKTGRPMSSGSPTPGAPDGMWTFKVRNELRIVRNHEIVNGSVPKPNSAISQVNAYDPDAGGGTTTLVVDPKSKTIVRDFVSLSGTLINCAGGPTPWGSWISCEETTLGPSIRTNSRGIKSGGFSKPHGYCFEVPASANGPVPPVPLKAMGRFTHEAISVDRKSGIVYLTEDYNPCGFYRFLPKKNKRLVNGGILQTLAVVGKDEFDTRSGQKAPSTFETRWVTIDDPDPASADMDPMAVSKQGRAKGAALFNRLEGCCNDGDGRIYFTSTSGGDAKGGQIWMYEAASRDRGRLTLLFESPDRNLLDMPDNICLMPRSDLLFICEDSDYVGEGGTADNYIRILTPDGKLADFAHNIIPGSERVEFAGATFAPDGKILFVNIMGAGWTFAIWGDWGRFRA